MSWIVFLAKLTQPNYRKRAADSGIPIFLTISFSHYVEFARWSLQLMNKSFTEHGYAPVQHILPLLATRIDYYKSQNKTNQPTPALSNDSETKQTEKKERPKTNNNKTSAPLLVLSDGSLLQNSWEIATWAGLEPPDNDDFKRTLAERVGPMSRQLFYSFVLKKSNENVTDSIFLENNHWLWKIMWYLGFKSMVLSMMRRSFKIDNREAVNECREELKKVVEDIGREKIITRSGSYIQGDKLTQSDIALASLLAPLLLPPEYALGKALKWFELLQTQDEDFRLEVAYWRGTAVGQYVLQLYKDKRATVL